MRFQLSSSLFCSTCILVCLIVVCQAGGVTANSTVSSKPGATNSLSDGTSAAAGATNAATDATNAVTVATNTGNGATSAIVTSPTNTTTSTISKPAKPAAPASSASALTSCMLPLVSTWIMSVFIKHLWV